MSKNDVTGDKLVSKVQSDKFSEGYDRIWGNKGERENGTAKKGQPNHGQGQEGAPEKPDSPDRF